MTVGLYEMKTKRPIAPWLCFNSGALHDHAGSAVYVVWDLHASGLPGLLLWLPQAAVWQPRADQPDPSAGPGAALVHEQVCGVSVEQLQKIDFWPFRWLIQGLFVYRALFFFWFVFCFCLLLSLESWWLGSCHLVPCSLSSSSFSVWVWWLWHIEKQSSLCSVHFHVFIRPYWQ